MRLVDADKFLAYLIFSKHIDGLTCGEVKEAVEICKVDVLDKIRAEVINLTDGETPERVWNVDVLQIIDKHRVGSEVQDASID